MLLWWCCGDDAVVKKKKVLKFFHEKKLFLVILLNLRVVIACVALLGLVFVGLSLFGPMRFSLQL